MDRLIPAFTLSGNRLFQTVGYREHVYLGDCLNILKIFSEKNVAENLVVDKSAQNSGINFELIKSLSAICRAPFCYGGGISSLQDIEQLIALGCERVLLCSILAKDPQFIEQAVNHFGSSSLAVCLELHDFEQQKFHISDSQFSEVTDVLQRTPVSEVIISDVSRNGTKLGLRASQICQIKDHFHTPVGLMGGCKNYDDAKNALSMGFDSVFATTIFTLYGEFNAVLPYYFGEKS